MSKSPSFVFLFFSFSFTPPTTRSFATVNWIDFYLALRFATFTLSTSLASAKTAAMHFKTHLLATLSALEIVTASPVALPQSNGGGADSCRSEPLTEKTWTTLKVDDFLKSAGSNLTTNNVQGFASSLGAPNFFWYGLMNQSMAGTTAMG